MANVAIHCFVISGVIQVKSLLGYMYPCMAEKLSSLKIDKQGSTSLANWF